MGLLNTLRGAVMFFIMVLISTLVGCITGWVVGIFFGDTILAFLACLGITGFKMWQIGAALGFIGSFFRGVKMSVNDGVSVPRKNGVSVPRK